MAEKGKDKAGPKEEGGLKGLLAPTVPTFQNWMVDLLYMEHPWKSDLRQFMRGYFDEFYADLEKNASNATVEFRVLLFEQIYRMVRNAIGDQLDAYTLRYYRDRLESDNSFPEKIPYRILNESAVDHLLQQTFFLPKLLLTVQSKGKESLKEEFQAIQKQLEKANSKALEEERRKLDTLKRVIGKFPLPDIPLSLAFLGELSLNPDLSYNQVGSLLARKGMIAELEVAQKANKVKKWMNNNHYNTNPADIQRAIDYLTELASALS